MNFHKHERIEIMYVASGICNILILDQNEKETNLLLRQGEMIMIDEDVWHKLCIGNEICNIINLEFTLEQNVDCFSIGALAKKSKSFTHFLESFKDYILIFDDGEILKSITGILHELGDKHFATDKELFLNLMCTTLLLTMSRVYESSEVELRKVVHIKKAIMFIQENYTKPLKIEEISQYVNINSSYLERLFKKSIGESIVNYINNLRVNKAIVLMDATPLSISEISQSVGFGTRQQFNNSFKKRKGISPQEYRNKNSQNVLWFGFTGDYKHSEKKNYKE